jgi:cell division ATPase FtsA
MKVLPKIFKKDKSKKEFLVLEVGLERINCAIFKDEDASLQLVGVGRKKFSSRDEIFNSTLEALDSLAAIVADFPREGILGVSGGSLESITTIARYTRPNSKSKINVKETERALKQVVDNLDTQDKKIFFTSIANAKIDGVKVSNPIGLKGKDVELSCFVALRPTSEVELFDKIVNEIDLKVEKVLPTSFAVAELLEKKNLKNVLIFRAGVEKSELTLLEEGHVSEVFPVDLGSQNEKFLPFAWESVLKDINKENIPGLIWLFSDSDAVDLGKLKSSLLSFDWHGNLKFPVKPKIEIAEDVHNFPPSDMGLYALSQEGAHK